MYKHDNAKYILSELEQQNLPNEMMIKVNLALAKLTDNSDIEFKYYEKALKLVDIHTNKQILAELYYKSAGSYDEQNDTRMAALYYKKCIELDSNPIISHGSQANGPRNHHINQPAKHDNEHSRPECLLVHLIDNLLIILDIARNQLQVINIRTLEYIQHITYIERYGTYQHIHHV